MAIDCGKRCKQNFFSAGKQNFSLNKAKKKQPFLKSLDRFRRLEVGGNARNAFVINLLHNIASSSSFLDFARNFSLFSLVFCTSKFLELKEFKKTIIPFALVGYETSYKQVGATCLVGY